MAFEQIVLINPNLKLVLVGHLNKSNDLNNCIKRLNLSKKIRLSKSHAEANQVILIDLQ